MFGCFCLNYGVVGVRCFFVVGRRFAGVAAFVRRVVKNFFIVLVLLFDDFVVKGLKWCVFVVFGMMFLWSGIEFINLFEFF